MNVKKNLKKIEFSILGDLSTKNICLVFIHGWGGNKNSFKKVAGSFAIKKSVWFLPQAPYLLDGEDKYSWTFEKSPGKYEREEPVQLMLNFLEEQVFSRFDSKDVFLFGFSQGALVCYELLKILDKPIAGLFPISGFIADQNKTIKRINAAQMNTPIVIGHGLKDEVVSFHESELAFNLLKNESSNVMLESYKGGHKIGYSYIKKIRDLIHQIH
tara:strand:+ start:1062 stop:1703 length:642 start_codon:yes stop_codon:yes gene_type:complete